MNFLGVSIKFQNRPNSKKNSRVCMGREPRGQALSPLVGSDDRADTAPACGGRMAVRYFTLEAIGRDVLSGEKGVPLV